MRRYRSKIWLLLLIGFISMFPKKQCAQTLDHKLVSLLVYNFTKYIDWPTTNDPFVVGIYGDSPIVEEFKKFVVSKKMGTHPISVKIISTPQEAATCQLLFIPETKSSSIKVITESLGTAPTLIVTEKPGLVKKGAGINIILDEDDDYKTKFEMNKTAITNRGMRVANNLILLAVKVI